MFAAASTGALGQIRGAIADLTALRGNVTDPRKLDDLNDAINHLSNSIDSSLWTDGNHLQRKKGEKVFEEDKKAIHDLMGLLNGKKMPMPLAALQDIIDSILHADRLLATIAVDEAESAGVNPKKIAEDRKELASGDDDADKGQPEEAIDHYRNAWKHAV